METQVTITITDANGASVRITTEDELRDKAFKTALALTLSEYPEDMDADWVIDAILNDDNRIEVWEALEYLSKEDIAHHIEVTAQAIYNTYFQ